MKNPLTVLVVEDNPNHVADLEAMLAEERPRLPIELTVVIATNLFDATLQIGRSDAVMSDVFFPDDAGGAEMPNGKQVLIACLATKIPAVWITSTYHHGARTDPVNQWGRKHGFEMFDCLELAGKNRDSEAEHKPWKAAFYGLLYSAVALELALLDIKDGKLCGTEPGFYAGIGQHRVGLFLGTHDNDGKDPVITKMLELGFRPAE
jgi:hypothetical protein